ncbi:hypothetical protein FAI40_03775 [Acetobacteraceae bacterium]|nr:hypothetical protein FAI40_03775 [Acetobacteraceae bacterium]
MQPSADMKESHFEIDTTDDQIVDHSLFFFANKEVRVNDQNEQISGYELFELVRKQNSYGEVRSVWQFEGFKTKNEMVEFALDSENDICAGAVENNTVYVGNVLEPVLRMTQQTGSQIEEELSQD